jgi:hypothetical protein
MATNDKGFIFVLQELSGNSHFGISVSISVADEADLFVAARDDPMSISGIPHLHEECRFKP